MLKATMVENHIHDNLQPFCVCIVNKLTIFCVAAEARVNLVVVGSGIAVIGAYSAIVGRVVLQNGSEP